MDEFQRQFREEWLELGRVVSVLKFSVLRGLYPLLKLIRRFERWLVVRLNRGG